MKRFHSVLASVLALWVLSSFVTVMLEIGDANVTTMSLVASMIASVIYAPVFVFFGRRTRSTQPSTQAPAFDAGRPQKVWSETAANEEDERESVPAGSA